jgi:hypothetical protein
LTGLLDVCFSSTNDYRECDDEKDGVAVVTEATKRSYTVVAKSESGTEFEIEHQPNGVVAKICSPGGSGGCPDGGHW